MFVYSVSSKFHIVLLLDTLFYVRLLDTWEYSLRKRKSADADPLPVSSSQGTFTQDVIPWTTYAKLKVINKEQLYLYAFVSKGRLVALLPDSINRICPVLF